MRKRDQRGDFISLTRLINRRKRRLSRMWGPVFSWWWIAILALAVAALMACVV